MQDSRTASPEPRPRVLLDCDGVLADFTLSMLAVVREITGVDFSPEQVTDYDFAKALGLTEDAAESVRFTIGNRRKFCARLAIYPGAREGVRKLRETGAEIYVVTSPWNSNETWMSEREWWLKRHFDIPHSHVIHGSAKHLVVGDFLVDDKTSTCVTWQAAHPTGIAVQWQTPHNRRDAWSGRSTRNWDELCSWVSA